MTLSVPNSLAPRSSDRPGRFARRHQAQHQAAGQPTPLLANVQWHNAVLPIVLAIAATLAAWSRLTPTARGTAWAEDGAVFLSQAATDGSWARIVAPYDGYLHVIPRLAARAAVEFFDPHMWAIVMNFTACVVAGLVTALVYMAARSIASSRGLRLALASITVATPLLPIEVLGNMANVHTLLLWAALWIVLYRPASLVGSWVLAAAMLLIVLTEVQVLFLAPLALVHLRVPAALVIRIAAVTGLAAQIIATVLHPRPAAVHHPSFTDLAQGYLSRVVLPTWFGTGGGVTSIAGNAWWVVGLGLVAISVLAATAVLRRGTPMMRIAALAFLVYPPVLWVGAFWINGQTHTATWTWLDGPSTDAPTRWAAAPSMLILAGLLLWWGTTRGWHEPQRWVATISLLFIAFAVIVSWQPASSLRTAGPRWAPEIDANYQRCAAEAHLTEVNVPLAPTAAWTAAIPCSMLTGR